MLPKKYSEKRDFIRMKIDTPVEIILEESNKSVRGRCIDLSGNGLLVVLNEALAPNAKARAVVTSNHGHSPTLNAQVMVARVMKHEDSIDKFEVAFEIIALD